MRDAEGYYLIERHALYMAPSVGSVVALNWCTENSVSSVMEITQTKRSG